jgi:MFS transporter, DHA3 family, macrolide efflux protein
MWRLLQHRGLRLIFIANLVSMIGSGMNTAAVTWFILQATHSELSLSALVVLQTVPALLMLPFTGVIIDREDRRRLIMLLDVLRGVLILFIAVLAFRNRVEVWHLYAMGALVAAGFWMFCSGRRSPP